MKRSALIFLGSILTSLSALAQGTDGVLIDPNNATTLDASAVFQAQSTSQGMLVPRMLAVDRGAIPVSAARNGLLVYQTDGTPGFYYYNGAAWVLIANTTSNLAGVTAGTGLTGGGTSGTVTLDVGAGNGITVNANDIAVIYGTGANTAVQGNVTGAITAGSGLTGGIGATALGSGFSSTLNIGAGTGITVNADDISSNLSTGIAGGQSAIGGTAASENLTLTSTNNATKGNIIFGTSRYNEANNRLG